MPFASLAAALLFFLAATPSAGQAGDSFHADSGAVFLDGNRLSGPFEFSGDGPGLTLVASYGAGSQRRSGTFLILQRPKNEVNRDSIHTGITHPHDVVLLALATAHRLREGGIPEKEMRQAVAERCRQENLVRSATVTGTGVSIEFVDGSAVGVPISSDRTPNETKTEDIYLGLARENAGHLQKGTILLIGDGYWVAIPRQRRAEFEGQVKELMAGSRTTFPMTSSAKCARDLLIPGDLGRRLLHEERKARDVKN